MSAQESGAGGANWHDLVESIRVTGVSRRVRLAVKRAALAEATRQSGTGHSSVIEIASGQGRADLGLVVGEVRR
jgi:hypothetical protein